jgi:hypothetical protein
MIRHSIRVPKWVFILGGAGVAFFVLLLVGLVFLVVQVGAQVIGVVREPSMAVVERAEAVLADPSAARTLDRSLACVDLVGGPSANVVLQQALEYAPTPEARTKVEAVGAKLGLPRPDTPPSVLMSHCVMGVGPTG